MVSAGTSIADFLHKGYEAATHAAGYGDDAFKSEQESQDQDQEQQADGPSKDAQGQGEQQQGWIGSLFSGPGNHPNDPSANVNYPGAIDTTSEPKDAQQPDQAEHVAQDTSKDNKKPNKAGFRSEDMIQKALGDDGPVGQRQGTWLEASMRSECDGPVTLAEKEVKPCAGGAEVGAQTQSEREESSRKEGKKEAKAGKNVDINAAGTVSGPDGHKEHAVNRGPSWASRPNDEQREKIRKFKAEQSSGTWSRATSSLNIKTGNNQSKAQTPSEGGPRSGAPSEGASSSPIRPGLNIFGTGTGPLSLLKRAASGSVEQGKGTKKDSSARSQSQWAANPHRLRGAFEMGEPTAEEDRENGQSSEFQPVKPAFGGVAVHDSPMSESPSSPLTPTQQKMRAISKIMLGSKIGSGTECDDNAQQEGEAGGSGKKSGSGSKNDGTFAGSPSQQPNRWAQLKKIVREKAKKEEVKNRASGMDLTHELQTGILPVFLLKMAMERDEQKHRRIPVLLNHLRLRVTDSVNPLHNTHAVFRIELEYGDGLVKWVVYRELRDFINLHTHYRAAALRGYLGRSTRNTEGDVGLPSFPKMSLPYLNQLQRQGRVSKADFARAQRDALENYIIELIRKTMFRPEANRLCKFFEISALSVSLASRGGQQGKQGYLRILSKSSRKNDQKGILTPARWAKAYEPKWFIVRESFIAIVNEPDTLQIYDVFLMDNDFKIERPKRLYKQTMHMAHKVTHSDEKKDGDFESSEQQDGSGTQKGKLTDRQHSYDQTALLTEGQFADPKKRKAQKKGESIDKDPHRHASSHTFYIRNSERRLKLVARNERQMDQFISSMEKMATRNIFSGSNRFGSFAPIRLNASAQWLIDGRDYFWNLSKALMMAKDRIFIHDWWLSPELYLRRPGQPKWRLDNILKKKAEEGVKVFVIIYNEVSNNFTPTDSNYTKQRLTNLHPSIYVQRSPSHFQTGTFYWAHHEKLCVIDETIAFMGGLDMCFGRWDTPAHVLVDDAHHDSNEESDASIQESNPELLGPARGGKEAHIWPGQDYANERVMEWHTLSKPHEDLFPREKFPRMPWHDVGLQLVGQPARDLCRHFAQRWNFLLRIKNHSRLMPFIVPPPDFTPEELQKYGLTGTCEVQICRSAGPWSLGTSSKVEHSIQNAYLKSIQMSDHFVYIENQFFVTTTVVEGTKIENQIGEALVSRIIRAHREGTPWRAIIVVPLIPGFPMPIDHPDASSVRLIVELQNRSISRGEHCIFGKLRREGINPDDYISFFSLRGWGKLRGGQLTTEQIYLHDKIMVVDDRLAIIGSANINERSQRGDRDSELACVIRDHDMINSSMGGKPYKVGRFAHRMRVQLMREHLGVDVDELEAEEKDGGGAPFTSPRDRSDDRNSWTDANDSQDEVDMDEAFDPDHEQILNGAGSATGKDGTTRVEDRNAPQIWKRTAASFAQELGGGAVIELRNEIKDMVSSEKNGMEEKADQHSNDERDLRESLDAHERYSATRAERVSRTTNGDGTGHTLEDKYDSALEATIEEKVMAEDRPVASGKKLEVADDDHRRGSFSSQGHGTTGKPISTAQRQMSKSESAGVMGSSFSMGAVNGNIRKSASLVSFDESTGHGHGHQSGGRSRHISESASSIHSNQDDLRRKISSRMNNSPWSPPADVPVIDPNNFADPLIGSFYDDYWMACAVHNTQIFRKVFKCVPDDTVGTWGEYKAYQAWADRLAKSGKFSAKENRGQREGQAHSAPGASVGGPAGAVDPSSLLRKSGEKHDEDQPKSHEKGESLSQSQSKSSIHQANQPSTGAPMDTPASKAGASVPPPSKGFSSSELKQMEALLEETRGSLVLHPTKFLEAEDMSNNFLYSLDRISPMIVYC